MKDCVKSFRRLLTAAVVSAVVFLPGCTDVDDTLGFGMLPKDETMLFKVYTLTGVKTYTALSDSIPSSRLNRLIIGNYQTDGYGHIYSAAVTQFTPSSDAFDEYENYYGNKPEVDSVRFCFVLNDYYGDPSIPQKFYVYPLTRLLPVDSLYYPDFDGEAIADMSNPVFSFVMQNEKRGEVKKLLTLEPAGEEFLDRLLVVDKKIYEEGDTSFRKLFNGFYIAPSSIEAEAPINSAIYDIAPLSIVDTYYGFATDYGYFEVNAHNYASSGTTVADTLAVRYALDDYGYTLAYPNLTISTIVHDYSTYPAAPSNLIDPSKFVDPETFLTDNPEPMEQFYVQGMLGVSSYLYFDDAFMDRLESLTMYEGEKHVMYVNKAKLYIYLENTDLEYLDNAPVRLGMYYNYKGYYPENIPDYDYQYEQNYNASLNYNGRLNRGMGYYEMDISMYIRQLANDPEKTPRQIWLSPDMSSSVMFGASQVALQNKPITDENDPAYKKRMRIDITYSLLKNKTE